MAGMVMVFLGGRRGIVSTGCSVQVEMETSLVLIRRVGVKKLK